MNAERQPSLEERVVEHLLRWRQFVLVALATLNERHPAFRSRSDRSGRFVGFVTSLSQEAYSDYCAAYAESWIEDQVKDMSPATRATLMAELRTDVAEEPPAKPTKAPAPLTPTTESGVPLVRRGKRDQYELTPPEAMFYDALLETGLTFSVQPWTQYVETAFRPDFFVHYDGKVVAVEIDGHDWHKTKEQRGRDSVKTRFFAARGIRVISFTASQVWRDAAGCVRELHDVLRESHARP